MTEAEDRYQREQGFHDQTFASNSRESAGRFYDAPARPMRPSTKRCRRL